MNDFLSAASVGWVFVHILNWFVSLQLQDSTVIKVFQQLKRIAFKHIQFR